VIPAVLQAHKHIVRFDKHGDLAEIGCGSTVGKVERAESGQTHMSLNVVAIYMRMVLTPFFLAGA
jgi:hypothetical protein